MLRKGLFAVVAGAALVAVVLLYLVLRPNELPSARFVAKPGVATPLEVVFDASGSRDRDGEVRDYTWDFGDGQTGTGRAIEHTYERAGSFTVTLTVVDNRGGNARIRQEVVAYAHLHKLAVPERWDALSKPGTGHPPLFAQIEPADRAVLRGGEAWVRWSPGEEAEGRVLWHKAGEADVRVSATTGADPLLARLGPLELGERYEYVVEQISGDFVQRSGLRTFVVEGGVVFDPPVVEQAIERDHDQTVTLTLRNETEEPITVAARALEQIEDLPADIVGPGSADQPVELEGGQTLRLRLAVFAADATRHAYEIPVEAAGAIGKARIEVGMPKLELTFRVVKEDPRTLAKWVEVRNAGDTVTDLALRVVAPHQGDVRMEPVMSHALLRAGDAMEFVAMPVLYLEFDALSAEIEARAAGQRTRFPVEFQAPPGKRLLAVRSRTSETTSGDESYCNPVHCTDVPGGSGNGAATPPGEGVAEAPTASALAGITEPRSTFPMSAVEATGTDAPPLMLASLETDNLLLAQAAQEDADPGGAGGLRADGPGTGGTGAPKPGDCPMEDECESCNRRAWALRDSWGKVRQAIWEEMEKLGGRPLFDGSGDPNCRHGSNEDECKKQKARVRALWKARDLLLWRWEKLRNECFEPIHSLTSKGVGEGLRCKIGDIWQVYSPDGSGGGGDGVSNGPPSGSGASSDGGPSGAESDKDIYRKTSDHRKRNAPKLVYMMHLSELLRSIRASSKSEGEGTEPPSIPDGLSGVYLVEIQRDREDDNLGNEWARRADDPPSPDFATVARPVIEPVVAPAGATKEELLGWIALEAQRWEIAYLKAYTTSHERYQGAQEAADREAMTRHASAMVKFADLALQAARSATARWEEYHGLVLALMERAQATATGEGISWHSIRDDLPADGLPSEFMKALRAAKATNKEIAAYRTQLQELTAEQAENFIAGWKAEVHANARLREIFPQRLAMHWPEPRDVLALETLQPFAQDLLQNAKAAASSSDTSDGGGSTPQTSIALWLRPGLLEVLRRRASFTRNHRGPFAAPIGSGRTDSSDLAAGWHAGDRVLFAWHQENDKVVFAAFDPRGETLTEPQVIGSGRWPRLAADGSRTAVAWQLEGDFTVRVHDGEAWGQEIQLSGQEAALAFAPGGGLHAVTSTGLWKLAGGRFEQVREASYSQPALAFDRDGMAHVVWQREGRVVYEDEDVDAGGQPTVVVGPTGAIHLAYLADGSLMVRSKNAGAWSSRQTLPAKNPSWPTLALGEGDGVRVTFIGDAEHGPPGLWLARLPDEAPVLVPSLAGNVTDAWFTLTVGLRHPRSHYRAQDVLITVNDVWVKLFDHAIPEGRYLFRLDPQQVFTSSGRPVSNRIAAYFWNRNDGANSMWANYKLTIRRAWSEYHGFASSPDEVLEAHEAARRLNHDRPDLALVANALELPVETPVGPVDLPVTIINLGEGDSRPAKLVMRAGDEVLHSARLPMLEAGEQVILNTRVDGHLEQATFEIEYEDADYKDFDPDNDSLHVMLWAAADYERARDKVSSPPPVPGTPTVEAVPFPNDIFPPWIAGRLPAGAKAIGDWSWEVVPRFNAPRSHTSRETQASALHYFIRAKDRLALAPGDNVIQYVYLDPRAPPKQILLQLFVEGRKEGQALYWGGAEDLIGVGGEEAKRVGELPEAGRWVRLRVPVELFGMENAWIDGLLFGQYGGGVYWGPTSKSISRLDRTEAVMVVSEN